jgi:hypothetical protein
MGRDNNKATAKKWNIGSPAKGLPSRIETAQEGIEGGLANKDAATGTKMDQHNFLLRSFKL